MKNAEKGPQDFATDEEWRRYCRLHWFESLQGHRVSNTIFGMVPWMFWTLLTVVAMNVLAPFIVAVLHHR